MAVVKLALLLYILAIVGVVLLSWFPLEPDSPGRRVFDLLRRITDPVLQPVRRVVPPIGGAIDLSPTIVLIVLFIILGALPG